MSRPVTSAHGTPAAYQRHIRNAEVPCEECRQANMLRMRERRGTAPEAPAKDAKGIGHGNRPWVGDLWPGITAGWDARCSCTWAPLDGTYQVKVRDACCLVHGGPLDAVLARMGVRGGD